MNQLEFNSVQLGLEICKIEASDLYKNQEVKTWCERGRYILNMKIRYIDEIDAGIARQKKEAEEERRNNLKKGR